MSLATNTDAAVASGSVTLADWLERIEQLHPANIELGLDRVRQVYRAMALPKIASVVITVAGTNGKGSSVALLESIYAQAGYKVAAYTSPHLIHFNERVRIDCVNMPDDQLCRAFTVVDQARAGVELTYFEFTTLAALFLIAQARADVALLEVGLGGRLDAVNVVDAELALITSISIDHQDWLGADREAIGAEKAGVMRRRAMAVVAERNPPESVLAKAAELNADLVQLGKEFDFQRHDSAWDYSGRQAIRELPLPGIRGVPLDNAAGALAVVESLQSRLAVEHEAVATGLARARLPGRYQVINGAVQKIFDVAHNDASAALLAKNLEAEPITGQTHIVIAMLGDKDCEAVGAALRPVANHFYLASLDDPRGLSSDKLADRLAVNAGQCFATPLEAWQAALANAHAGDRIVVCGSFLTVGALVDLAC